MSENQFRRKQGTGLYTGYATSNDTLTKFVENTRSMSQSTAYEYSRRLSSFAAFIFSKYRTSVDMLIDKIKSGSYNPYDVLSGYSTFLLSKGAISSLTLKQRVVTAKNLLEYFDVAISPRIFKIKVKLPKATRRKKQALSKEDIIHILNACSDIRLKTYIMFLASTGCRAVEALSIRYIDLDERLNPARILVRAEFTKTKVDRIVFLSSEMTEQLHQWLEYKYRARKVCRQDQLTGKTIVENRTPKLDPHALIFAVYQDVNDPKPRNLYINLRTDFAKTLDRIGKGSFEDNKRRRKITLHSFRRWVKSTISDLGHAEFSGYFIGHTDVSTYYQKTDKEMEELYRKIEPSLTFLDFPSLERKGADVQSKIDVLEQENYALRQRDSDNTDAIHNLSDQLMKVMEEVQELKHKKT